MDTVQLQQEAQYDFPYHYIPTRTETGISTHIRWGWGLHYLVGIDMAMHHLQRIAPTSVLDVGCGDGRFLREVRKSLPNARTLGIDYSARAITLARALNPGADYETVDITQDNAIQNFDAVTLIEVIEHIHPDHLGSFLMHASNCLASGGAMVVTVPHCNVPLQKKHYQHFSSESLRSVLSPHLTDIVIIPFGHMPLYLKFAARILGLTSGPIIVDLPAVCKRIYNRYRKLCVRGQAESQCSRLLVIGTRR
jgi:2-polyprenyl-3-methyl-5-hydroxy-6-metoxy-1,4-benzoquinol methylase